MKWAIRAGLALVALAAILVGGLYVASRRSSAGWNEVNIVINRPPEKVFPWLTEPEKLTSWIGGLVQSEPLTEGGLEVGARSREHVAFEGQKLTMETLITSLEVNRYMGVKIDGPDFVVDALYELSPRGGGTLLRYTSKTSFERFAMSLMEPLITPSMQKKLEEDLERLRALAEGPG